jgi:murein DD-endopeptidase MepM/ murein hydrolase activator NlpD
MHHKVGELYSTVNRLLHRNKLGNLGQNLEKQIALFFKAIGSQSGGQGKSLTNHCVSSGNVKGPSFSTVLTLSSLTLILTACTVGADPTSQPPTPTMQPTAQSIPTIYIGGSYQPLTTVNGQVFEATWEELDGTSLSFPLIMQNTNGPLSISTTGTASGDSCLTYPKIGESRTYFAGMPFSVLADSKCIGKVQNPIISLNINSGSGQVYLISLNGFEPGTTKIEGQFFLDANGTTVRDKAVMFCPRTPEATSPALDYFFPGACTGNKGKVVTVMEPLLSNLGVCFNDICTTTGPDGSYSLVISATNDNIILTLKDPNADTSALALRFFNLPQKAQQVSEATCNGTTYPAHTLMAALLRPVDSGLPVQAGVDMLIGLMQGRYTAGFDITKNEVHIWNYYDIDGTAPYQRDGRQANYFGLTVNGWPGQREGVNDFHAALDFSLPPGTPVFGMSNGSWLETHGFQNGWNIVYLTYGQINSPDRQSIQYGHLAEQPATPEVMNGSILRGQIIACSGNTADPGGDPYNQLHVQLNVLITGVQTDFFRDMTGKNYKLGSKISYWSLDNTIVSPIPGN